MNKVSAELIIRGLTQSYGGATILENELARMLTDNPRLFDSRPEIRLIVSEILVCSGYKHSKNFCKKLARHYGWTFKEVAETVPCSSCQGTGVVNTDEYAAIAGRYQKTGRRVPHTCWSCQGVKTVVKTRHICHYKGDLVNLETYLKQYDT